MGGENIAGFGLLVDGENIASFELLVDAIKKRDKVDVQKEEYVRGTKYK